MSLSKPTHYNYRRGWAVTWPSRVQRAMAVSPEELVSEGELYEYSK